MYGDPLNVVDVLGIAPDLNLLTPGSDDWVAAQAINEPGYFTVAAHGNSFAVYLGGDIPNVAAVPLSASELANLIRVRLLLSGQNHNRPILLVACSTGGSAGFGNLNFAQKLSNALNYEVWAPNTLVWPLYNGSFSPVFPLYPPAIADKPTDLVPDYSYLGQFQQFMPSSESK